MADHLTASELASLIGCKANQRAVMARWLDKQEWRWVQRIDGLPRVARAFYNKKMGISDGQSTKLTTGPDLQAFGSMGRNRH